MKINKYIGLAVCALFMASCQNDEVVSDQPSDNGLQTLIGQIGRGDADSRAQIQLGNPSSNGLEIFFWNEEDRFKLYQNVNGTLSSSEFLISEEYSEADGGDLYSEFFTADKPELAPYVAVYPHTLDVDSENTVKLSFQNHLDFSAASKEEVWKNYFKKNMYMIASGTLKESGSNLVNFQHQCALIRITYTNKTSGKQTISGIGLGGDQFFGTSKTYNVKDNYYSGGGATNGYTVTMKGMTVEAGASEDFYILFFPEKFNEGNLDITIMFPTGNQTLKLPIKDLEEKSYSTSFNAGTRYWFDIAQTAKGLDWTKNTVEDGQIVFTDKEFSKALYDALGSYKVRFNEDSLAVMSENDVRSTYTLDFGYGQHKLTSLEDLEHFIYLQTLICIGAQTDTIDLSKNKNISYLDVKFSKIKALDLSEHTSMRTLICSGCNELTTLKYSENAWLTTLDVNGCGKLEPFTVHMPSNLQTLSYGNTNLDFDLSLFTNLTELNCAYTGLTTLDAIPSKYRLKSLSCSGNELGSLDLAAYNNLTYLAADNIGVSSLDFTWCNQLQTLYCAFNNLKTLDLTPLYNLQYLKCGDQKDNGTLILKVTDAQKERWNNEWKTQFTNDVRVYLEGEEPTVPGGNGSGSDYGNGGIF